jgi:hypothetical protein
LQQACLSAAGALYRIACFCWFDIPGAAGFCPLGRKWNRSIRCPEAEIVTSGIVGLKNQDILEMGCLETIKGIVPLKDMWYENIVS